MTITNITYDGPTKKQLKDLPIEIVLPSWILDDVFDCEDLMDVNQLVSNYISNQTSWLVSGYDIPSLCKFSNLNGYEGEFTYFDIEDLDETIVETFGLDEDGELTIDHENRYFEYTEEENNIKVTGNF